MLELQNKLNAANDFHYPAWWGAAERQQHRNYIADLEERLDDAIFWAQQDAFFESLYEDDKKAEAAEATELDVECDAFEAAYDKHIEEMACGGFDY